MQAWIGKTLVIVGVVCLVIGLLIWFAPRIPWLGRLPGDLHVRGEKFSFYFPIVTCIFLSLLLTVLLNLILRR